MISFVINISLSLAKLTRSIFVSRNPPSTFWFLDGGKISISIFPFKGFLHSPKGYSCSMYFRFPRGGYHILPQWISHFPPRGWNSPSMDFGFSLRGFIISPSWISSSRQGIPSLPRGLRISDSRTISKLNIPGSTRNFSGFWNLNFFIRNKMPDT